MFRICYFEVVVSMPVSDTVYLAYFSGVTSIQATSPKKKLGIAVAYFYTVFHKKLYPLLFRYIFSFTKTNFMKIPLSMQEVLVIMSIK